jgi:hypothetical protein
LIYRSVSSVATDAYRAGHEIGISLQEISPEIILLLTSISYEQDFGDLFDGLYDALGTSEILVFGGTGDGIYETSRTAHYGICALGITSKGKLEWSISVEEGVAADSYSAARACASNVIDRLGGQLDFAFVLADGVKADGSKVVAGLESVMQVPFFGGLTGDDRKFTRSRVIVNGRAVEDAVAVLGGAGDLPFRINAASGWTPIGEMGRVEDCQCSIVRRISGVSAQTFMKTQLGKPVSESDLGVIPLATYKRLSEGHFALRTSSRIDPASGSITTFGSIEPGEMVRVCTATREEVIKGVKTAMQGVIGSGFTPAAAIVISCAGRKWLLEDRGDKELREVFNSLGTNIPLIGFPSFGEISPFRKSDGSYTPALFHNVTFVICLLGNKE